MEQAKGNQARRLARLQAQQPPQRRLAQAGGSAAATPTKPRPVPKVFEPSPIRSTAFRGVVGDDKGKTFNELVGEHLASRDLARFSMVNPSGCCCSNVPMRSFQLLIWVWCVVFCCSVQICLPYLFTSCT